MTIRIGLPRGLLYYHYGDIWHTFIEKLGAEVIVSGETTKETIDLGSALDEVCLPVKVFFGHAHQLQDKIDYLFVPRVTSVSPGQFNCPKIIGLPDILRSNIPNLPMIDFEVNLRNNKLSYYRAVFEIGRLLGRKPVESFKAWFEACCLSRHFAPVTKEKTDITIGVLGHPYILFDRQISMNVLQKIGDNGVQVVTPEAVSPKVARVAAKKLSKGIFWSYSHHLVGTALYMMESPPKVDGIIYLSSFACGPDSMVGELIKIYAREQNMPFMLLTVDEHSAEAGIVTRLEAYLDMVRRTFSR